MGIPNPALNQIKSKGEVSPKAKETVKPAERQMTAPKANAILGGSRISTENQAEEPKRRMTSSKYGLYNHINTAIKPVEETSMAKESTDLGADKEAIGVPKPRRGATKTMLSVNEILNISRKTMGV